MNSLPTSNAENVVLQPVDNQTLTVHFNGQTQQIGYQLAELKSLLQGLKIQHIQYADKIYNIEHINEANFEFITEKKPFNEWLTKRLTEAIAAEFPIAQVFLQRTALVPNWEAIPEYSDVAKNIIASGFVGMIGIQLSKLLAIGKLERTESKNQLYVQKCIEITRTSLDLACFTLFSRLWDSLSEKNIALSNAQKTTFSRRLDSVFELPIMDLLLVFQELHALFASPQNDLEFPIPEFSQLTDHSNLTSACMKLQALSEKYSRNQVDMLDCFEAEKNLTVILENFKFWVNYRVASIKEIGFQQNRNDPPHYIHHYNILGPTASRNNAEKINYTGDTVQTEAILLYKIDNRPNQPYRIEDYRDNINLFPFYIDFNGLTHVGGSKTFYYRSQSIHDGSLEYSSIEDNSVLTFEERSPFPPPGIDINEYLISEDNRKTWNLNRVVQQFRKAQKALLGVESEPITQ